MPSAKVLGGEFLAGNGAKIVVDVARADVARMSLRIEILEKFLTRKLLATADNAGKARIIQLNGVFLPPFPRKEKRMVEPWTLAW